MSISTNLKALLAESKISIRELSRRINVKQPSISQLISGEKNNPTLSTLKALSDYFSVSINQLVDADDILDCWTGATKLKHFGWTKIPLLNDEQLKKNEAHHLTKHWISVDCEIHEGSFGMEMKDKSMEPAISCGSIVVIDPYAKPMDGDLVLIKYKYNDQLIFLIRFLKNQAGNNIFLTPSNYFDTIENQVDFDVVGVVVQVTYNRKVR